MSLAATLVDSFGRVHTNLRISVTDRCNIRCFYCMPEEGVQFKPRHEILSFEEIERFVRVAAGLGVRELRLTGGEPLVRADLTTLVARLAAVPGIDDLAMTTKQVQQRGRDRVGLATTLLLESRLANGARDVEDNKNQVLEIRSPLPALRQCPVLTRILDHWDAWIAPDDIDRQSDDFWGL